MTAFFKLVAFAWLAALLWMVGDWMRVKPVPRLIMILIPIGTAVVAVLMGRI